jgi:hypothetical protein
MSISPMKHIVAVRVPDWGLDWIGDARYYGFHWSAHVGPWLVFLWLCSAKTMDRYDPANP